VRYYYIQIGDSVLQNSLSAINGLVQSFPDLSLPSAPAPAPSLRGRRKNSGRQDFISSRNVFPTIPINPSSLSDIITFGESLTSPPNLSNLPVWSSVYNGQNDPGALDIEFDITDNPDGTLVHGSVTVRGISQSVISQANNYNNQELKLYAGFWPGLPLATQQFPHQGLIADGKIWPCFGNWIGNDLSITFIMQQAVQGTGGPGLLKNIIHNMPVGTPLSSAINSALSTAFPGSNVHVNISDNLVLNYPDQGYHQGAEQYLNYLKSLSHSILGTLTSTGYQGIGMSFSGNNIYVADGTKHGNVTTLSYDDLIGQPTWSPSGDQTLQVKVALRGDITPMGPNGTAQIILPKDILVTSPSSNVQLNSIQQGVQKGDVLNFTGIWDVRSVRHVGKFRQPTGEAWVTIIDAYSGFGQDRPSEY
jgi:hypothetical protein